MAKKLYSLDFSIQRDIDRLRAVEEILDKLDKNPSPTDLEQMASYILYGKDENGNNSIQRNETIDKDKRFKSYKTKDDATLSLDEMMQNPMFDEQQIRSAYSRDIYVAPKATINRPRYNKETGEMIDPGDSDIPGMVELWDTIDRWEHYLKVLQGKIPPDESITTLKDDPYNIYLVKHNLIDIRRTQYYLKDAYKPVIKFSKLDHPRPQYYDWYGQCSYWISMEEWERKVHMAYNHTVSNRLEDYETRNINGQVEVRWIVCKHDFDWENPQHIRALFQHYGELKAQIGDKLNTYGITLLWDLDRYCKLADISEMRMRLLHLRFDQCPYEDIVDILNEEFGVHYDHNHLAVIVNQEIPRRVAAAAKRRRMMLDTPKEEMKKCHKCGKYFPNDPFFFNRQASRKDGLATTCKECGKAKRIAKGVTENYDDHRRKDSLVSKVQKVSTT